MDAASEQPGGLNPEADARPAAAYARRLLDHLGLDAALPPMPAAPHAALAWARSGLMALTGHPDGRAQLCPVPLTRCAEGALQALAALAPEAGLEQIDAAALLAERAAIAGFSRNGGASPGGACQLLQAADGWFALNLPREDDWSLLPAWLEDHVPADWSGIRAAVRARGCGELVARARLLGLACAPEGGAAAERAAGPAPWFTRPAAPPAARAIRRERPLVVDLSSLWAGPLCSHLLQRAGADVVKVESPKRPDGARYGPPDFFDLLNANKRSAALDPTEPADLARLRALIGEADIVIEGSRPRALRQLGIDAEALVAAHPQLTWIGISGYGRGEPQAQWVAYGDDAGIAAGLSRIMADATGERLFVGDAIADPLTGLHAALLAWSGYLAGGGGLLSLSLADVVRHCIGFDTPDEPAAQRARHRAWQALLARSGEPPAAPRARPPARIAHDLGADTAAVLADLGIAC